MAVTMRQDDSVAYVALSEAGFALGTNLSKALGGEVHALTSRVDSAEIGFTSPIDHLVDYF